MADEPKDQADLARIKAGDVDWAVGVARGRVAVHFPIPVQYISMDPENCRLICEGLLRAAYEARYGVKPSSAGSRINEETRLKLIDVVAKKAGSMARDGKNNLEIATGVVDQILTEVL